MPSTYRGQNGKSESLGTGVAGGCEPPHGCCELNQDFVEDRQVLLTAELARQPLVLFFKITVYVVNVNLE